MNTRDCTCEITFTPAVGTHDTVTNEWLDDRPTTIVHLEPDKDCPMHPSVGCGYCSRRSIRLRQWIIDSGWALRADKIVAWCPDHIKRF